MWVAAGRRFLILLSVTCGAIALCALGVGLLLGISLNRSLAVGFEAFGCLLLVLGFFVGNRGPVRLKREVGTFFGPRFLRWATPDEHASVISESAIFIVLGFIVIMIGLVIDTRYRLF